VARRPGLHRAAWRRRRVARNDRETVARRLGSGEVRRGGLPVRDAAGGRRFPPPLGPPRRRSCYEGFGSSRPQYVINILWSGAGAAALILNGMLVSPYLIRKLGVDTYGIWALGLSLVEYFWMIDLGVRPATVKLTAEYRALEKWA